jgi:3-oxoadipate CoA-transferase alpha subunit
LITSIMKSEPGRSITMSPGWGFSRFLRALPSFASAADTSVVAAAVAAPAPAAAALRKRAAVQRRLRVVAHRFLACRKGSFQNNIGPHMIDKEIASPAAAVADLFDGATVMIGGFGNAGMPVALVDALIAQGSRDLTLVNNNAGNGETGIAALLKQGRVRRSSAPSRARSTRTTSIRLYRAGKVELELVPQGNLALRIQAAGAGLGAVFTPTGYGTELAQGKETREIDGRHYVLEYPIRADFALIKADRGDRWGNLVYRKTARNFGPHHGGRREMHHRPGARGRCRWVRSTPRRS